MKECWRVEVCGDPVSPTEADYTGFSQDESCVGGCGGVEFCDSGIPVLIHQYDQDIRTSKRTSFLAMIRPLSFIKYSVK